MLELKYNKEFISCVIKILFEAYKYAVKHGKERGYKEMHNCFHTVLTDEFFNRLYSLCYELKGFKPHIFKRGNWKLLYILDEESKSAYSFMTESSYKRVSRKTGGLPHYLQATLAMQNNSSGKLEKHINTTLTIEDYLNDFNTDNIAEKGLLEKVYKHIYGDLSEEMKQYTHFIIVYKKDYNGIVYIRIVLHDSEKNKTIQMPIYDRDKGINYADIMIDTGDKVFIKEDIDTSPKVTLKDLVKKSSMADE